MSNVMRDLQIFIIMGIYFDNCVNYTLCLNACAAVIQTNRNIVILDSAYLLE